MGHPAVLPIAVVAPIIGALAAALLGRWSGRAALVAASAAMGVAVVVLTLQAPAVFSHGRVVTEQLGGFNPAGGHQLAISWSADGFGLAVALVTAVVGTILVFYTLSELSDLGPHELGWLAALLLLLAAGVIGAALTADLLNLFVWFEVSALASYGLTAFWLERPSALEATFKLLVLTAIASFFVFLGVGLLYQAHGAVNLGQLHAAMRTQHASVDVIATALLVGGFATKAGLVPFHMWLPDAHSAAPGPVSAMFSGLMVTLGIVGLVRTGFLVVDTEAVHVLGVLMVVGVASGIAGAVAALGQDDLKRLLAFDTVSQVGIIVAGFATANPHGIAGATLHLVNHACFKSLLFLCASAIIHTTGTDRISELGDMARRQPVIAATFVIGAAALAGVPPLNGYASASLLDTELRTHHPIAFAGVLVAQIVTVAALSRATWLVFFRHQPEPVTADPPRRPNTGMVTALAALSALSIGFGVVATYLVRTIGRSSAAALGAPQAAAAAVLGHALHLSPPPVPYHLVNAADLATTAVVILGGVLLGAWVIRARELAPVRWVRALHTGSVHDDVFALVGGFVAVVAALAFTR